MDPNRAPRGYTLARYVVAFAAALYGFAKLTGAQFTILDSELDKPLRDVSGFWLTWYYFGYSPVYGTLLALTQIACGLLLTLRRTALLGAAVLFGMTTNVVLVDLCYGVDPGGVAAALLVWVLLVVVLAHHRRELAQVFWASPGAAAAVRPVARPGERRPGRLACAVAGRLVLLGVPAAFTYWVANYNNRLPTPLDGAWYVVPGPGAAPAPVPVPTAIYFERTRAMMAVFRYSGAWATRHFEVDAARRSVRIWDRWLTKGPLLFAGHYALAGGRLALTGDWAGVGPVRLELRRGPGTGGPGRRP
jgi:hypothetical protein